MYVELVDSSTSTNPSREATKNKNPTQKNNSIGNNLLGMCCGCLWCWVGGRARQATLSEGLLTQMAAPLGTLLTI